MTRRSEAGGGRGTNQHKTRGTSVAGDQSKHGRPPQSELRLSELTAGPPPTDETETRHRLWQITDSAELCTEIVTQAGGFETFASSRVHQAAAMQAIANIGEAVRHLPDDFTDKYSDIPWSAIRGMRNRVSHGYDTVDVNVLWRTISTEVPSLIDHLDLD